MNIQLKTVFGELIIEGDFSCMADCVKAAIGAKKSLSYANLRSADLSYANLSYADLSYADLSYANLRSANLSYANLRSADLSSANLSYADLSYANLRSANLSYADLSYAKNSELAVAMTRICADGEIIGWKKLRGDLIAKLLIGADVKRNNAFGRKCRAESAKVLEIWDGKKPHGGCASSNYDSSFLYEVGKTVKCDKFDEDFANECSSGIHFFITRLEAESYQG